MAERRVVGIDLGTTHTVVAFAEDGEARLFPIPQLVDAGKAQAQHLLPSALYAPVEAERVEARFAIRGPSGATWVSGEHARRRGSEASARMVSSAKSWLSHAAVDRRAAILPWRLAGDPAAGEGADRAPRLSPVDAAALVLAHVQKSWDAAHPDLPLSAQEVVITVPASFDAVARQLTVEAAEARGLRARLLEEQ